MAQQVVSRARALSATLVEGAYSLARAIMPTAGPVRATFSSIESPSLPRANHTICDVKGRAYIFGGETAPGTLADGDMHMVILPSSAVLRADYRSVPARPRVGNEPADVPAPRRNHAAAIVGDDIFVFGGEDAAGKAVDPEHPGRIWVFETSSNTWAPLDPPEGSPVPPARAEHALTASEFPLPEEKAALFEPLPQTPMDPENMVPEIPDRISWGTLFVAGGRSLVDGELLGDAWAFDVKTRTWTALAPLPGAARVGAGLAVAGERLYRFGGFDGTAYLGGGIDSLNISALATKQGDAAAEAVPLAAVKWEEIAYDNGEGPRDRSNAGLVAVAGAQGRNYLLAIGGEVKSSGKAAYFDDVWAFQLPAEGQSELSKRLMGKDAKELSWSEIEYQYVDVNGDIVKADQLPDGSTKKGMGGRGRFAVASGTEVDGASVIVWGGLADESKVCSDGWLITVER